MLRLSQEVAGRPNPQIRYRRDGVDGASFMHLTEEEEDQGFVMRTIARYGPNLGGKRDWHVPVKDGVLKNMGPKWEAQLK
jgi:hypothetical protein